MTAYLIVHGLENVRPQGHWHRILTAQLRAQGHTVIYPQLPQPVAPVLDEWLEVLKVELEILKESGFDEVTVVAHSLGCVAWLHFTDRIETDIKISKILFVAPADPDLLTAGPTFQTLSFDQRLADKLHNSCGDITVIASEADPWLPKGVAETFSKPLNMRTIIFEGAGHISMSDDFGPWPGVLNWLLDPTADIKKR